MNCLCCGKPLENNCESGWHKSCIKSFFSTDVIPEIEISPSAINAIADSSVSKGYTVPGVQKKISLHLSESNGIHRLTLLDYPAGYILKPQVSDFEAMPECEHLTMCMAQSSGIATVPHALIGLSEPAYITKRVDRISGPSGTQMLAMEDFCQLDRRLTKDKYNSSYERCAKVIQMYSSQKTLDLTELFLRLVFCFVVGNSDMHLKNFSLIESEKRKGEYYLSPAYDLLPVNILLPEDTDQFALTINGKKRNIRKKDFIVFAQQCGISTSVAEKIIKKILSMQNKYTQMCTDSLLPEPLKASFIHLIDERCTILSHDIGK